MLKTDKSLVESLLEVHKVLGIELQHLESLMEEEECTPEEVGRLLNHVQAHIMDHFRFEEDNGYMTAVIKREPYMERTIQNLLNDHHILARDMATLIGEVKALRDIPPEFRKKVRQWIQYVHDHEARENILVQDTFNRDDSVGD